MEPEVVVSKSLTVAADEHYLNVIIPSVSSIPAAEKAAVLTVKTYDRNGTEFARPQGFSVSRTLGPFQYVHGDNIREGHVFTIPVETECVLAEVTLVSWKADIAALRGLVTIECVSGKNPADISPEAPVFIDDVDFKFEVRDGEVYSVKWSVKPVKDGRGLLLFNYLDEDGEPVMPPSERPIHPELGAYSYASEEGITDMEVDLKIPKSVRAIEVTGENWKGGGVNLIAPLTVRPKIETGYSEEDNDIADAWLSSIESSDDVIVIYTTAGPFAENNNLLLRSNRMAIEMASKGWKVVYVPFSNEPGRIVSENILQISSDDLREAFNTISGSTRTGRSVFVCSSRSDIVTLSMVDRARANGWRVIYETRDDMEEFQRVGYSKWYRAIIEKRIADSSDAVLATSPRLRDRILAISRLNQPKLLPNAVPDAFIEDSVSLRNPEAADERNKAKIVGYLGHLTDSWFDWPRLLKVMRARPETQFEIIGHGMPQGIQLPHNANYLGAMAHDEAIKYMSRWRVGLIPFIPSRLTFAVDPNKVYEYIAAGLKTLSAPMGDVTNYPGVQVYRNEDEFLRSLDALLDETITPEFLEECQAFTEENSWSVRMSQFAEFIEGVQ